MAAALGQGGRNAFDLLRIFFAMLVVFEHAYFLTSGTIAADPLYGFSGGQMDFGSLGVNGFFVISGFLIARSWEGSSGLADYLSRRLFRIFPGFLVATLILMCVGIWSAAEPWQSIADTSFMRVLAKALTLHSADAQHAFPENPVPGIVAGTFWSIKYEFDGYLLIALFGLLHWFRPLPVFLALAGWMTLLACQQYGGLNLPVFDMGLPYYAFSSPLKWPRLFSFFFAGMLVYLLRHSIVFSKPRLLIAMVLVVASLRLGGATFVMPVLGTYCMIAAGLLFAGTLRVNGQRTDLSYGTYLYGFPIQQVMIASMPGVAPLPLFFLSMLAVVPVAWLSWVGIERPMLKHKVG